MGLQKRKKTNNAHMHYDTVNSGVCVTHCVTFGLSVIISASPNSDLTSPKLAPRQTDVLAMFLIRL